MFDLIVIGAGPGGYEAALHAARKKKKVALFERTAIGGTCLNVGCIPTKALLKSAHVLSEVRDADKYGVSAASPAFSMERAQERKNKIVSTLIRGVEGSLKKEGVEILRAHAMLKGRGKVEANGMIYEASNILIATGSKPAVPPIPGIDSASVLDSTDILSLPQVPESLVIIGAGVIGLEFAGFFSEVGTRVCIVEMLAQIAPVIDGDISKRLMAALKKKGVELQLSAKVTKIEGSVVYFTDALGQAQTRASRFILNATGRKPVLDNLGLEALGVDFSPKGIVTDDQGRTNVPGLWACGDVTGRCLLAHAATREGIVAVENMFGGSQRIRTRAIPSVVYTDPEVAGVGKTEEQLTALGTAYRKSLTPMGVAGRFLVEYEGASGTLKVLAGKTHGEILGIHIIGGPCSEYIFAAAMMIENEMRIQDVAEIVFPHPTISEALKEAILRAE
jgi:dihydrolipoamide dehydrogenase